MSTAFFQQVDATVHSLIQKAQAKLGITLSHSAVPPAVHGALLQYRFNSKKSHGKVLEALKTIADTTDEVIISFIESDILYLQVGFDAFGALRLDTGKNSPLWNMLNAPPIGSDKQPQWLSVGRAVTSIPLLPVSPVLRHVQLLANHLRTSLRLNPGDLLRTIRLIEPVVWSWKLDDPSTLSLTPFADLATSSSALSRSLYLALGHMVNQGYSSRLEEASSSMANLQALGDSYQISTADRSFFGTYVVALHHTSSKFQTNARLLCPSFFIVILKDNLQCNPHVHIVEYSPAFLKGVMLISFSHAPDKDEIDRVRSSLHPQLRLPEAGEWTITLPWHYNSRSLGTLFRPDGMVNFVVMKEKITGSLKSARSIQSASTFTREVAGPKISKFEHCQPRMIVIWLRQSSHKQESNIGRQLWFILSKFPTSLLPLQAHDTVTIAVEFCSSLQHRWNDRCITSTVLKHIQQSGKEGYIVTGWADRLTRRREDLQLIFADLSRVSTTWLFRGVADTHGEASWLNGVEQLQYLEQALSSNVGTERPSGYEYPYMATRIIEAGSSNYNVGCLNATMTATLRNWQIKTVIIYCRVSPGRRKWPGCTPISLERQLTLLRLFCPPGIKIIAIREDRVSAYRDMDRSLVSTLTEQTEKCCVFAVSLDRILRRVDALPHLRSVFAAHGHKGVCFLWDCYTTVPLCQGLGIPIGLDGCYLSLENALQLSRRAQPSRRCLPLVQPIAWTVDSTTQTLSYDNHILRHAEIAEVKCLPFSTFPRKETNFTAPEKLVQVDAALLRTESRDWSTQRQERWAEFVNQYLTLGPNRLLFLQNGTKEWLCRCDLDKHCDTASCGCDCKYCKLAQRCACQKAECQCPEVCNCSCDHCHHGKLSISPTPSEPETHAGGLRELSASEANQAAGTKTYSIDTRQCTVEGCKKPSTQRSWRRYLCSEHDRKRKLDELLLVNCLNRLCLNKRSSHIPHCSLRCYEESVNDPQLCEIEDCLVPCPPDLKATRCMRHHQHAQNNAYVISNIGKAKDRLEAEYYGIFEE